MKQKFHINMPSIIIRRRVIRGSKKTCTRELFYYPYKVCASGDFILFLLKSSIQATVITLCDFSYKLSGNILVSQLFGRVS